jgi:hypothetical protein
MPANPKYLNAAFWPRFSKVSAAILGSFLVTLTFHQMLISWFDKPTMLITTAYTGFIVWVALMIVTFLAKSGWKMWALYLVLSIVFSGLTYLGILYNT